MAVEYLITGASGQLGRALGRLLGARAVHTDLPGLDVSSRESVSAAMDEHDPACIINCAAITDVDLCQRDPGLAIRVHHDGVANLAATGRRLLTISTDHVFTGSSGLEVPFMEDSPVDPANTYAESKLLGEEEALRARADNIVVRTSWMYSGENGLLPFIWRSLTRDGCVRAVLDQRACLTYAPDLAAAIVELTSGEGGGIYHLVNRPGVTPAELALRISSSCGGEVVKVRWSDLGLDAPRPLYSVLGTSREISLPDMDDAFERWRKSDVGY
jgi:dTDP-4-dehydrorhamnose reductase